MMLGKRFVAALAAGVAFLALGLGQARADGPTVLIEKGTPNSGVKEIQHTFASNGLRPPFAKKWEISRQTFYVDGRDVVEVLNRDGTVKERTTNIPKDKQWIKEVYRPILRQKLWMRSHNLTPNQVTTEYYGLNGRLRMTRIVHKAGGMDVMFCDATKATYVQHWVSGIAGYTLVSVDVTPWQSQTHTRYVLLGNTVSRVEHYAPDGTVIEVLILHADGSVLQVETWSQKKLLKVAPGLGRTVTLPAWSFKDASETEDPFRPK